MTGGCPWSGDARPGRRAVLGGSLAGVVGALGAASGLSALGRPGAAPEEVPPGGPTADPSGVTGSAAPAGSPGDLVEPFHGTHQAGVLTPPQPHGVFVGLDLAEGAGREQVESLMRIWSQDAAALMAGRAPVTDQEPELAARTAGLTVTVGWGAGVWRAAGLEPPPQVSPLPDLEIDELDDTWRQTDLVLQICSWSPVTLHHARRHLVRTAHGLARPVWVQPGFREPMERDGWALRNLFGQVDGTVQPEVEGRDAPLLWIDEADWPGWGGGTTLVLRRIAMDLDGWVKADRTAREHIIGRDLAGGAPLTGGDADTPADLHATDVHGFPLIDVAAHIRRSAPHAPHERFLRRPYSYEDIAPDGTVRAGLLFAAYQADVARQFLPVQERLAEADLLNIYTTPVGSGVWAVPPGAGDGEILGQGLLG